MTVGSLLEPNTCGDLSAGMEYRMPLHDLHEANVPRHDTGWWYSASIMARLLSPPAGVNHGVQIST